MTHNLHPQMTYQPFQWIFQRFMLLVLLAVVPLTRAEASEFIETSNLLPLHACIWDPIGKAGPAEKVLQEVKIKLMSWGINLTYDIYSDERVVIEEFKLGRCDAANMLDFRVRPFNKFTGSISAIGALSSYEQLGVVLNTLATEKAAPMMTVGDYEITGFGPAGAIFLFTRDRTIIEPEDFGGKRMAVLDEIPEVEYLTKKRGISPVRSGIFDSFLKFNNGAVDMVAGPAIVYEPFELYKGLEPNGGIFERPFLYITMQIVTRKNKIPEGVGQKGRNWSIEKYKDFVKFLKDPEDRLPEKYKIKIPERLIDFWVEDFRQSRLELAKMGIYDPNMLKLMRKVRCKFDPHKAECSANEKE